MKFYSGIVLYCVTEGRILLISQRSGEKEHWLVPHGSVEAGESYTDAAVRAISNTLDISDSDIEELCTIENGSRTEKYFISYSECCLLLNSHAGTALRTGHESGSKMVRVYIEKLPFLPLPPALKNALAKQIFILDGGTLCQRLSYHDGLNL